MKAIYFLLITVFVICQFSLGVVSAEDSVKPEKVYRIIYVQKPNRWYQKQAQLWKAELKKNPNDPVAWNNYYNAVRYANFGKTIHTENKTEKLKEIVNDMKKYVPNSFEYYYLKHSVSHSLEDISDIEKAYQIAPDRPDTYYDFITFYDHLGNQNKMDQFLKKLYFSEDIAPSLLNYNFNTLMTCKKNAILFTNGDNDTYPAWVLQRVKGIRNDVLILNVSLISTGKTYLRTKLAQKNVQLNFEDLPEYRSKNFIGGLAKYIEKNYPSIPVYFALTVYENHYKQIKDDLYIVGLAYRFSSKRIDNLAFLKENLENKFRLDYLKNEWYAENYPGTQSFKFLVMNYVVPMIMLAEHFHLSGETDKANKWEYSAQVLAETAGNKEKILQYLKEKGL